MTDPREPQDELSPAERRAFEALAREVTPPSDLEERTVALLRRTGHLPTPIGMARGARREAPASPGWKWIGIGAAAAMLIFTSGIALGQYMGMRNAALVASASARNATEAAMKVNRSGDLYVAALASLSNLPDTSDIVGRQRAREAALRVLGAAAEEISHIAPDDPLAAAVLRGLNERGRTKGPEAPSRSVIWY